MAGGTREGDAGLKIQGAVGKPSDKRRKEEGSGKPKAYCTQYSLAVSYASTDPPRPSFTLEVRVVWP